MKVTEVRWCASCYQQGHLATQEFCDRCEWLQAIGVLVGSATETALRVTLVALDAVAFLLRAHAIERQRHRRELNEATREQSRAAREGYNQGREEADREREW